MLIFTNIFYNSFKKGLSKLGIQTLDVDYIIRIKNTLPELEQVINLYRNKCKKTKEEENLEFLFSQCHITLEKALSYAEITKLNIEL
jgi:hypothetical protein